MNLKAQINTKLIKEKAIDLGFDYIGVSKADFLEEEAPRLESWLNNNFHGKMNYMENYFDLRLDPRKLVPNAKSVISFAINYFPKEELKSSDYKISKYAYGEDYHKVIKKKLKQLLQFIRENIGEVEGRGFVDSAPVLDKAWAQKSGLGWIGKNANLINKSSGSYFFIAELIVDLELEIDSPTKDYCGTCTKCIDACPTGAIISEKVIDAKKCISYLTIELKDSIIDNQFKNQMSGWVFGCDICMDVCPWNRFSKPNTIEEFQPKKELLEMTNKNWEEITSEVFDVVFEKSAIKRTKFDGLKRNINFLKKED